MHREVIVTICDFILIYLTLDMLCYLAKQLPIIAYLFFLDLLNIVFVLYQTRMYS